MQDQNHTQNAIRNTRIQKLTELADKGINPYPYSFDKNASAEALQKKYENLTAGEETQDVYSVAGRVMAMRNSGMFIDLMDDSGKIQIFCPDLLPVLSGQPVQRLCSRWLDISPFSRSPHTWMICSRDW